MKKSQRRKLTPAALVAKRFGSFRIAADKLGYSQTAVSMWNQRGGSIPARKLNHVMAVAKAHGIKFTADELVNGGI